MRYSPARTLLTASLAVLVTASAAAPTAVAGMPDDAMVDAGGFRLHFRTVPGDGLPILFESGGGEDAAVWGRLLGPVAEVTGAPLITYDRPGFGTSELDPARHGIVNDVRALETGLAKLGYGGDVMVVAHSLGAFYATLFAARNARRVKALVLIDGNHACFFTDEQLRSMRSSAEDLEKLKSRGAGRYYQALDFEDTVGVMRTTPLPKHIPVLDLVAERTLFEGTPNAERWRDCHRQFAAESPARRGLTAFGSGHYVFVSNPELVVAAIAATYARVADEKRRPSVLARAAEYAVTAANEVKRKDSEYSHSEDDLNSWGYALLGRGEIEKAIAVFGLNVTLYPKSPNAHDSLAEAYEAAGDRERAIEHYRRVLEIDPEMRHARERLDALLREGR